MKTLIIYARQTTRATMPLLETIKEIYRLNRLKVLDLYKGGSILFYALIQRIEEGPSARCSYEDYQFVIWADQLILFSI